MSDTEEQLDNTSHSVTLASSQKLEITRDFHAPRERVWMAWTKPDAVVRWLGPRHYPAIEVSADVRVGLPDILYQRD
jgi:uncharacterized protein YndB with AHSA1/START domain